MDKLIYLVPAMGVIGLLYTLVKFKWVSQQDAGSERMQEISRYIAEGAMAFLKAEWKILGYFVVIVSILLAVMASANPNSHYSIAFAFILGAVFSATAGYIGMRIATKANVRTAQAARTSLAKALNVSFTGGSVMGLGVAGLAVLGLGGLFIILKYIFAKDAPVDSPEMVRTIEVLTGFSLGAESIALFARVGGGIYTKAADVGADLVGKVEAGIPEDDPRNPATIADNVGDNVGDVAGMGADLFGSYVATVLATMVLGQETKSVDNFGGLAPILLPMLIAGVGILFSIVGTFFVRISENAGVSTESVQRALNMGNWGSIVLTAIASVGLVYYILPETMTLRGLEFTKWGCSWSHRCRARSGYAHEYDYRILYCHGQRTGDVDHSSVFDGSRNERDCGSGSGHAINLLPDSGACSRYLGFVCLCRFVRRCDCSSWYDGHNGDATCHRCVRTDCRQCWWYC